MPVAVAAAAVALKTGHFRLTCSRHGIWLEPEPRPACPDCHCTGGWWTPGPYPEMEAFWCWAERRAWTLRLLPAPSPRDEELPF
ncbi:hypothetical protein AB0D86_48410 [Streptomyces sp. NPDC048324]|uniref:hypothetical protein n=1 Tax=Streptomyces sp. NPDC048324 TaxID=3157205 RepID=UPI00343DBEF1